jgi:putative membrane protein insertion efficiency factor
VKAKKYIITLDTEEKIYKESFIKNFLKKTFINMIKFYKNFISPFKISSCKFYPSCSDYAIAAIEKYGICRGILKTIWRILRCNPFNKGGVDFP